MQTAIICPCYNEANRLETREFKSFIQQKKHLFLFVNDGSHDNTLEVLQEMAKGLEDRIKILDLKENMGKAEAVRAGFLEIFTWENIDFIGYWDADLATPLDEIDLCLEISKKRPEIQFICGSRIRKLGSNIRRNWKRRFLGRVFAEFASFLLQIPVYDTQCGAKLIHCHLAQEIFQEPFISKWIFDVELLARTIKLLGLETAQKVIYEVPLQEWEEKGLSKLRPIHYFKAPMELYCIYKKYKIAK